MKKVYLMKGMAAMTLGLVVASCNKADIFNAYADQEVKEQEFTENFQNNVMGGKTIDPNQDWSTTTAASIAVTSETAGRLKVYAANPIGEVAAPLFTQDITAGTLNVSVAKPADINNLYAALYAADGSVKVIQVSDGKAVFSEGKATNRAVKRATQNNVKFPDAPNPDNYKSTKPDDAELLTGYTTSLKPQYIDPSINEINNTLQIGGVWSNGTTLIPDLYVVGGTVKPIQKIYIPAKYKDSNGTSYPENERPHIYICNGATLVMNEDTAKELQKGLYIYVDAGAKLVSEGELCLDCVTLYNNGTVSAPSICVKNDGILYNQGVIETAGNLGLTNANSYLVNEGKVTVGGNYGSEGSGSFWNAGGEMTVTGNTTINSNCNGWVNDGQYTTNDFKYEAGSVDVWNNCKLTCKGQFYINLGSSPANGFSMDAGSSVVAKDTYFGACARINMGKDCVFKTETATMNNTNHAIADGTEGFIGPKDGWAVFQAGKVVRGDDGDKNARFVAYVNNVYVAVDAHFPDRLTGNGEIHDLYLLNGAKMINGQTNAPVSIPKNGKCSDGYGATSPTPVVEPTMYYYYAFEDLGTTDDFDFNDVVIRVSAPVNGVASVELVAAGGTMPTKVTYKGEVLGSEVHQTFGVEVATMVNTGAEKKEFKPLGTIEGLSTDTDMAKLPFGITVTGNGNQVTRVENSVENNGKAPLMIIVSGDENGKWFWATERTNITAAYAQFGEWGANASSNADWYKNYTDGKVWKW